MPGHFQPDSDDLSGDQDCCCGSLDFTARGAAGVRAQQQPTSASMAFAEVVVTAQKREENLQEVPVPVSVLNADALAEDGKY